MRSTCLLLLVVAVVVNAFVDDAREAVVTEAFSPTSVRSGRQLWTSLFSGFRSPAVMARQPGTGFPVVPASTQPLSPVSPLASALCRTTSGQLAWCTQYQFPGIMGWPGQAQYPGAQYPGIQYPGAFPGQQPGGFPGGQPGGFPGQQPGGFPGQQPGGFPGQQPGGFPGQQPGGFPVPQQPGQQPGPVGIQQQPVVTQTTPATTRPTTPRPPLPVEATVVETETEEEPQVAPGECGVGKYFPIRYNQNGSVAEEIERIELEEQPGRSADKQAGRIVSGWNADEGEWPWIAALMNNGRQFCGGSLIDDKHILTAAHCVAHMSRYDVANLKVRLGDYKIKTAGETKIFESKAARVVRHKEFTQQTLHKDVAIITMEEPVPASFTKVRPVCLPTGNDQYTAKTATVIGWGSLRENGPQPDVLQEMTVAVWDNQECKETYGNAAPGGIMPHMLCAGFKGKDSCSGDSGGPMQIGTGNKWTQIGIVSWGIGCGKSHYPGVYTRVTEVKDWIDRILTEY